MIKKYPSQYEIIESTKQQIILKIPVESDLFWFKGHFENFPLLAGVAQLDWVMYFFEEFISKNFQFKGIQQVKYQQPIFPLDTVTLSITLEAKNILSFEFKSPQGTKSKGKLTLISL